VCAPVQSPGRFEVHACGLDRHVERVRKPAVERGERLELPLAELSTSLKLRDLKTQIGR